MSRKRAPAVPPVPARAAVRELAERYATPLPQLTDELQTLAGRVEEHLKKMGASWN